MVVAQQAEIEHLKLIIAKLRRMQFGQSSEKIDEMVGLIRTCLDLTLADVQQRGWM